MKKTLIISSLRLILIVLMTAVSAADNTTTLTQQNDEIITIENRQINEINDCSAGTDTNSGLEQNFTSESQTLSPKNTDSQSKKLETNFKNNILTATNTDDLLTANVYVSGNTFADIQTAINNAQPGDNIFLDGKTYTGSGTQININKTVKIYGGSSITDTQMATLDSKKYEQTIFYINKINNVVIENINFKNLGNNPTRTFKCINTQYSNHTNIINCSFSDCIITNFGVVWYEGCMDANVIGCNFTNIKASSGIGGILSRGSNGLIDNCRFVNCSATYASSIEILNNRGGLQNITNCVFVNNTGSVEGTVTFRAGGYMINCTFNNNTAPNGGAICVFGSDVGDSKNIINCTFKNNIATNTGGAIYSKTSITHPLNVRIINSTFFNNTAVTLGGAISLNNSNHTTFIENCNFTKNMATNGGAIYNNVTNNIVDKCQFNAQQIIIQHALADGRHFFIDASAVTTVGKIKMEFG